MLLGAYHAPDGGPGSIGFRSGGAGQLAEAQVPGVPAEMLQVIPGAGRVDEPTLESLDEACRVRPEDLAHLAVLRETLSVLNDAGASAGRIAECIERFPALKARVQRRHHRGDPRGQRPSLAVHLARLGNREFERLLLELLEDLTMLRGELDEAAEQRASMAPGPALSTAPSLPAPPAQSAPPRPPASLSPRPR